MGAGRSGFVTARYAVNIEIAVCHLFKRHQIANRAKAENNDNLQNPPLGTAQNITDLSDKVRKMGLANSQLDVFRSVVDLCDFLAKDGILDVLTRYGQASICADPSIDL